MGTARLEKDQFTRDFQPAFFPLKLATEIMDMVVWGYMLKYTRGA
jgi:hypothetical protein